MEEINRKEIISLTAGPERTNSSLSRTELCDGSDRRGPFEVPEGSKGTDEEGRDEAALTKSSSEGLQTLNFSGQRVIFFRNALSGHSLLFSIVKFQVYYFIQLLIGQLFGNDTLVLIQ